MEPNETSLSTLEAVVSALQQLEPETRNIEALTAAFDCMIEKQLAHPKSVYSGLAVKPKKSPNANIPKSLAHPTGNLVLAYGEATPIDYAEVDGWADLNQRRSKSEFPPVYWCAQRLGTDQRFSCFLNGGQHLAPKFLNFMDLHPDDFQNAVSPQCFARRWNNFVNDDDLVLVYNHNALRLLLNCGISPSQWLLVNSINFDPTKRFNSLEQFIVENGGKLHPPIFKGRAGRRLATMTALIETLKVADAEPPPSL
jgi:hypothetical protein